MREELAEEIDQTVANTSQHLQRLLRSGLVESRRDRTRIYYSLSSAVVTELWRTMRRAAEEHVAGLERLAADYVGDRSKLRSITRDDLRARLRDGDVVVLDVRPAAEYAAGHVRGAISIPISSLKSRLGEIPDGSEVVAYCRGPYCVYADDAVRILARRVSVRLGSRTASPNGQTLDYPSQGTEASSFERVANRSLGCRASFRR